MQDRNGQRSEGDADGQSVRYPHMQDRNGRFRQLFPRDENSSVTHLVQTKSAGLTEGLFTSSVLRFSCSGIHEMRKIIVGPVHKSRMNTGKPSEKARTVDAVNIALDIMEAIPEIDDPTVTGIAEEIGLSPSTVYNHLATLEDRGYVVKEGYEYRPSLYFMRVGGLVRNQYLDIYEPAKEVVEHLAEETGEVAWMMVEENGVGIFVLKEEGENAVESGQYSVGSPCPLHASAAGKVILAHMPEERVDEIIDQHGLSAVTRNTVTDPDALKGQLERIHDQGVAFSNEEGTMGTQTVAVPILGKEDQVLASISVSGPTSRINDDQFKERLPSLLVEHANIIEIKVMNE